VCHMRVCVCACVCTRRCACPCAHGCTHESLCHSIPDLMMPHICRWMQEHAAVSVDTERGPVSVGSILQGSPKIAEDGVSCGSCILPVFAHVYKCRLAVYKLLADGALGHDMFSWKRGYKIGDGHLVVMIEAENTDTPRYTPFVRSQASISSVWFSKGSSSPRTEQQI
jgi:hypothetical protein